MYEITIEKVFAASHAIRLGPTLIEPIHGHNWPLRVTVAADVLDAIETVMDFHELEKIVDALIAQVHNRHLNDVRPFGTDAGQINPTAERVAWWFGSEVARRLPASVRLVHATVGEAPGCFATWYPQTSANPQANNA